MKFIHKFIVTVGVGAAIATPIALTHRSVPSTNVEPTPVSTHAKCTSKNGLPDPVCNPGIANPDVTQANISQNICNPNWSTKTIRPPASYTTKLKIQQIAEYGYADTDPTHYEEDHIVALTDGGHPTDPRNLWPQAAPDFHVKDKLEVYVHGLICDGTLTLKEGQDALSKDWKASAEKYGLMAGQE